ncbi:MAG TPA: hypothetical protein VIK72_02560 [Clostridiaceae bacterium]
MNLQNFVTLVIEALGGIVEPIEYALCEALIPEEYKYLFQGKSELLLAFDFEVAEENPEAEFVTFGSYVLDQLLQIIKEKTITTVRYVIVDNLKVSNPQDKIKNFLKLDRAKIEIIEENTVLIAFAAFNFITGYTVEERIEERNEIWIDMTSNTISNEMLDSKNSIFYEEKSKEVYSVDELVPILNAFETAYNSLKQIVEMQKLEYKDDDILHNEISRIEQYYEDLFRENRKKMQRKGADDEKIKELKAKEETLQLEKQRQLKEITEKYSVVSDMALDSGIIYFLPVLEYRVKLTIAHKEEEQLIYYNSITREFGSIK